MKKHLLTALPVVVATVFSTGYVHAQSTGSQAFRVIVPSSVSISPPAPATITHDETDETNLFPPQAWTVRGNVLTGVTVDFQTQSEFIHTTNPVHRRDASLSLGVGTTQGPGVWQVTTPTDRTNHVTNDVTAQVTAVSDGVGRAELNLTVGFVTDQFGEFAAGTYEMTILGTIAAN